MPHTQQALTVTQLVDVIYAFLVDPLLHYSPDLTDRIALLRRETPDFISPDQWPPNSPDMNPVDYKIWAVMQQRVYEKHVNDVDELCQRLLSVWHSTGLNVIDKIDPWRERLTTDISSFTR